jgi:hypothetical protein
MFSFVNQSENRVSNFNFRAMWENILFWAGVVFQVIACIVYTPFFVLFGCLQLVLLDNPVMFTIWSHLFPKGMAEHLYELPDDRDQNIVQIWYSICFNFFLFLGRVFCCWTPRYFAWYAKKVFIAEHPVAFNSEDVFRYLNTLNDSEKVVFCHRILDTDKDGSLRKAIWENNNLFFKGAYMKAKEECRMTYSIEELQFICDSANYGLLDSYMNRATLSEDMLKIMIASHDERILARVKAHIIKNGVSAEFVKWATSQGDAIAKLVDDCLTVYSQIQFTNQLRQSAGRWTAYCRETKHFFTEAEKLFDAFQAMSFYANGHKEMSEEAIFHFFTLATKEKNDVADVIFKNEGIRALKSERIKTLVKTNYWLNCHALELA